MTAGLTRETSRTDGPDAVPRRPVPVFGTLVGATVVGMTVLILYPIARLLIFVFNADGSFSTRSISATLGNPALPSALLNTLVLIAAVVPCSVVIGSVLAWLNERTDARLRWVADVLPTLPLLVPPLALAVGWVFLLAPTAGFLNVLARRVLHPDAGVFGTGPASIYNMWGMVAVTVIATVPYVYITVAAALRSIDPALEEASFMSGRGPLATLWRVTLPAIRNALVNAALLVIIVTVALFSVPNVIGSQGGIDVLTVLIFRSFNATGGPQFDQMIVLSVFMLLIVQVPLLAEFASTRSRRHATIGGRGQSSGRSQLGAWRVPARVATIVYVATATMLPIAALALVSLQGFWSPAVQWGRLSLRNYEMLFRGTSTLGRAFVNSLVLGIVTATALMVVSALIAYLVTRSGGTVGRLVNAVTGLPASVPHVVTGVAFLLAFGSGVLHGTYIVLFLAYLVIMLPLASRAANTALSQAGSELLEGSLMSGATHLRTFLRILMPLMLPGLLAGWVIVFVNAFTEISASVFLSRPTTSPVSGPAIIDAFSNSATFPQVAALALSVTLVQVVVVLSVQVIGHLAGRRGGRLASRQLSTAATGGVTAAPVAS